MITPMSFLIPSRRARPADDPIFALHMEARARAQAGASIVNATVGALLDDDGKLALMPSVIAALREVPPEISAAYAPIAGQPDFLRAVARDLFGEAGDVGRAVGSDAASELAARTAAVATVGGTGAIRHALANFVEPGRAALTTSFFWGPYRTLADEGERSLTTFRMFDDAGSFDVPAMRAAVEAQLAAQGRSLVLLNSPCHNPTGSSFNAGEWRAACDALDEASARGPVTLLVDVAYARYAPEGMSAAMTELLRLSKRIPVAFAWSASKSYAQYGLRLGALVVVCPTEAQREPVQSALTYSCRGTWSNVTAAGMAAITRVLVDETLAARVTREREALRAMLERRVARWNELAKPAGLRYPRYDGGFFTTVFCADAAGASLRLKEEGVFVVPVAGALRVALCSVAERDIERVVTTLARHASPA